MEEEDGVAYDNRRSAMENDALALNYPQKAGSVDAGGVDLVGRLKTLSSGRKKLMTKYFDLEEVENGPLLSEYFAVSLAFVALGAMIREANVRMRRKDKDISDGVSPKLQRMALDSMLKSAMERLRGLAHRTQTLEAKLRNKPSYMEAAFQFERLKFLKQISSLEATITNHEASIAKHEASIAKHVEAEVVWRREKDDLVKRVADVDAQRGYFFKKMAEAEGLLADMQRLRMEDGKANAKLVEIYAGREQSWKSERSKMRHEIELLKEKLSKLQPQTKSPGSFNTAAEAVRLRNLKRRAKEMVREKAVVGERELLLSSLLNNTSPTPKWIQNAELSPKDAPPVSEGKDLEGVDTHELSAAQNQEMEAELAIILKRVGALKRRGASGGKLDELLNEAKGKPKLKRFSSFDQPPRGLPVDDVFLVEAKDVGIDDKEDLWQGLEAQEGKTVESQAEELAVADQAPVRLSVQPNPPEKSNSSPRTPHWLTVVDSGLASEPVVAEGEPVSPDDDDGECWEEFIQVKASSLENNVSERDSWEELVEEKHVTRENSSSEHDSWEEFIQEKLNTLENNISERTPEEWTDHDRAPESVVVNRELTLEQLNFVPSEGGWVESVEHKNFKGYSITCAEPVGHGLGDLILFEDDIKSEIHVGSDQLQEAQSQLSSSYLGYTEASSTQEIDLLSAAESGNPREIPGVSPAHDAVEHSEIIVSNPVSTSPTLDSDHLNTEDHTDKLNREDLLEWQIDDVGDNGQSSTDGQNLPQTAQDDLNNATQQLAPDQSSLQLSPG